MTDLGKKSDDLNHFKICIVPIILHADKLSTNT